MTQTKLTSLSTEELHANVINFQSKENTTKISILKDPLEMYTNLT
jgi:hypothetical protein